MRRMMALTPAERLELAGSMFEDAREMVRAGILQREPGLNEREIAQRMFVAFYGKDFPPEKVAEIVERIGRGELGPDAPRRPRRKRSA
jgi:hypothetical protein